MGSGEEGFEQCNVLLSIVLPHILWIQIDVMEFLLFNGFIIMLFLVILVTVQTLISTPKLKKGSFRDGMN